MTWAYARMYSSIVAPAQTSAITTPYLRVNLKSKAVTSKTIAQSSGIASTYTTNIPVAQVYQSTQNTAHTSNYQPHQPASFYSPPSISI